MDNIYKNFIKENIDLIEENAWQLIYKSAIQRVPIGQFTQILLEAKINPLDYLDYIPEFYLRNTDISEFKIPDHIKRINYNAFKNCHELETVYIPKSVTSIDSGVFSECRNLKKIIYDGTIDDWNNITFSDAWITNENDVEVITK